MNIFYMFRFAASQLYGCGFCGVPHQTGGFPFGFPFNQSRKVASKKGETNTGKSGLRGPSLNHSQRHRFKVRGMASGLELVRIDGSTPPITRQGLIAKFMAQALRRTSVASVASGARALQSNFGRTSVELRVAGA